MTAAADALRLVPLGPEDAAEVQAIYAPVVHDTAISFELEPPSVEEMARRIESGSARHPWLGARDADGRLHGYAYACTWRGRPAYDWICEVSVYVDGGSRRGGVGRTLYAALLAELEERGYVEAYAGITLPNPASVAFHEACGFTPLTVFERCGFKQGRWLDVGFWRRPLAAREAEPLRPCTSRSSTCRGRSGS